MDSNVDLVYKFDWVEYSVFIMMLGLSASVGIYFGFIKGGQDTVSGYLYGGKTMSIFPIAMSLSSSFISGITLLGVPADTYLNGTQYQISFIGNILMALTMYFVVIPVFYKLQLLSLYEYFEMRFNRRVRVIATIIYALAQLTYLPVVVYGPALAINQVSGINIYLIATVICTICIFYTTVGGLRAVVWADALQGMVMVGSIIAVTVIGIYKAGGVHEVVKSASDGGRLIFFDMDPDLTRRLTFWTATLGLGFQWTGATAVNPSTIQRFLSVPTERQAKISSVLLSFGTTFYITISGIIGLIMYARYKDCDPNKTGYVERPDQMVPYFVLDIAGNIKGLPSLYLSGIVCAALSTMSTFLNTVAGALFKDIIEPALGYKMTEATSSRMIKCLVIILGAICVLLVFVVEHLGAILEICASFEGMTGGVMLGIFLLGLLFPTSNAKGAIWGGVVGISFIAFISAGFRINEARGLIKNEPLPTSTDNCLFNVTHTTSELVKLVITKNKNALIFLNRLDLEDASIFLLFRISMYAYGFIGCITTIIVGLIVSHITGPNEVKNVDKNLLSPVIYKFLPKNENCTISLENTVKL